MPNNNNGGISLLWSDSAGYPNVNGYKYFTPDDSTAKNIQMTILNSNQTYTNLNPLSARITGKYVGNGKSAFNDTETNTIGVDFRDFPLNFKILQIYGNDLGGGFLTVFHENTFTDIRRDNTHAIFWNGTSFIRVSMWFEDSYTFRITANASDGYSRIMNSNGTTYNWIFYL